MKRAIIFHGMPDESTYKGDESQMHWIPWLKRNLEKNGFEVLAPELPKPYQPDYECWKDVFEKMEVTEDTVLIGHSCGAGFFVRYLSENSLKAGKVFLIAPWLDPDRGHLPQFFAFTLDNNLVNKTAGMTLYISQDDNWEILESVRLLEKNLFPLKVKKFQNRGHFTQELAQNREFPELLRDILE